MAVANRSLASSERVAAEFNIATALGDWQEVLSRDDVDAVLVGTQPYFHYQVVMSALDAGKHVLCQTRMATSLWEAREMRRKLEQSSLKAMLIQSAAYASSRRYVRHLLQQGYVGQVRQVLAFYLMPNYIDSNAPLHRRQDQRNFGVINPMALGIYWDVLRQWFGDAERVLAWGKTFTRQRPERPGGPSIEVALPDAITVTAEIRVVPSSLSSRAVSPSSGKNASRSTARKARSSAQVTAAS